MLKAFQTLQIPGYSAPSDSDSALNDGNADKAQKEQSYKIPPLVWMVLFLVIGYAGIRMLLEE